VLFVSARRGEGVTTVARAVAEAAGPGAVYAIDLDLKRNGLAKALSETAALGPKIDGRLGNASFYTVRGHEAAPAFSYHRVGRSPVFAGVFDARLLPTSARVAVSARPDYWDAARAGGATIVVDAPALERSQVALRVAPHMDGVVLVVGADKGAAPAAIAAKAAFVNAGANVIGLVYAGASTPVMAIERLMRQAG
jgi:Mrp family chromosome partitioning ATPase